MRSVCALLGGLIDYGGLFPPAQRPMPGAVQRYAGHRRGSRAWILGRFIVPVARLEEFERAIEDLAEDNWRPGAWPLSVLGGRDLEADLRKIVEFNQQHAESSARPCQIEAIEIKVLSVEDVERAAEQGGDAFELYVEVPIASDPDVWIAAAGSAGVRVKVRTGGVTEDLFPSPADLARFLVECARAKVPFKATAGLHHPLRSRHPPAAEPGVAPVLMHGFLNVFLTAGFVAGAGMDLEAAVATLEDTSTGAFVFTDHEVSRGPYRLDVERLRSLRRTFATGFGSCSFEEPIEGLRAMGLLPD